MCGSICYKFEKMYSIHWEVHINICVYYTYVYICQYIPVTKFAPISCSTKQCPELKMGCLKNRDPQISTTEMLEMVAAQAKTLYYLSSLGANMDMQNCHYIFPGRLLFQNREFEGPENFSQVTTYSTGAPK